VYVVGDHINHPLVIPAEVDVLKLGSRFNSHIQLPLRLHTLVLGDAFNQPLDLPPYLRNFQMGEAFNQNLIVRSALNLFVLGKGFESIVHFTLANPLQFYIHESYSEDTFKGKINMIPDVHTVPRLESPSRKTIQ
jgi:hypothetical protein